MYRRFRALSMALAVAVLAALLVAAAPGSDQQAKAALGPLQAVTLTAADFDATTDNWDFSNSGYYVVSDGNHAARIPFPAEVVVITSVKVRVLDNDSTEDLCVTLYRARPGDGAEDHWGSACTSGMSSDDPQTLSITAFQRVGKYHTGYLWASFSAKSSALALYGATVFYRVVT